MMPANSIATGPGNGAQQHSPAPRAACASGAARDTRWALELVGELLTYPREDVISQARHAAARLNDALPEAAAAVSAFAAALNGQRREQIEEAYTRAFDVAPQAIPYLSVYLFGQESYKRAQLMTGLIESYARAAFDRGTELPDHIGVVLRFAPRFSAEEWAEMKQWCLPGPLAEMVRGLERAHNPFEHLLRAARLVLECDAPGENSHG